LAVKSKSPLFDVLKKLLLIFWLQFLLGLLPSSAALANPIVPRPLPTCFEEETEKFLYHPALVHTGLGLPILGIVLIGTSSLLRNRLRDSDTSE
jgi:hypothetical protein